MPRGLYRNQESGQSHFVTFSCYRRQPFFNSPQIYDLFPICLERTRQRFQLRVYGYVVMPEHVHILLSEPDKGTLADAIHFLKLSFTKTLRSQVSAQLKGANLGHPNENANLCCAKTCPFWQARYYDRNVRNAREFTVKLRYLHRNPVKRGLVENPEDWKWSSFRHYALREIGVAEIESEWTGRDRELKLLGKHQRVWLKPADWITVSAPSRRVDLLRSKRQGSERKGAEHMKIVGCDLHTRYQQVAMLDTGTGQLMLGYEPEGRHLCEPCA